MRAAIILACSIALAAGCDRSDEQQKPANEPEKSPVTITLIREPSPRFVYSRPPERMPNRVVTEFYISVDTWPVPRPEIPLLRHTEWEQPRWPALRALPWPGLGPVTFFGVPCEGRKIVYVIYRGGGATDWLLFVKHELKQSIGRLGSARQFDIIFWSTGPAVRKPGGMVPATAANVAAASEFVDGIIPVGQTDPSDGLRQAFALQPDSIYLLNGQELESKIPGYIAKLRGERDTRVHTIQLLYRGGEKIMKQIAGDTGGTYGFIDEADLFDISGGQ